MKYTVNVPVILMVPVEVETDLGAGSAAVEAIVALNDDPEVLWDAANGALEDGGLPAVAAFVAYPTDPVTLDTPALPNGPDDCPCTVLLAQAKQA